MTYPKKFFNPNDDELENVKLSTVSSEMVHGLILPGISKLCKLLRNVAAGKANQSALKLLEHTEQQIVALVDGQKIDYKHRP